MNVWWKKTGTRVDLVSNRCSGFHRSGGRDFPHLSRGWTARIKRSVPRNELIRLPRFKVLLNGVPRAAILLTDKPSRGRFICMRDEPGIEWFESRHRPWWWFHRERELGSFVQWLEFFGVYVRVVKCSWWWWCRDSVVALLLLGVACKADSIWRYNGMWWSGFEFGIFIVHGLCVLL